MSLTGTLKLKCGGGYIGDGPIIGGLKKHFGPTAVLTVDGIDPTAKAVVVLKSMQHFRAALDPIAAKVIVCDSGALCTPDLARLSCRNVTRPVFPLDQTITTSPP